MSGSPITSHTRASSAPFSIKYDPDSRERFIYYSTQFDNTISIRVYFSTKESNVKQKEKNEKRIQKKMESDL